MIQQMFEFPHSDSEKYGLLVAVLQREMDGSRILVFCATKRECDEVTRRLRLEGWPALSIHGDKSQGERDWVLGVNSCLPGHVLSHMLCLYPLSLFSSHGRSCGWSCSWLLAGYLQGSAQVRAVQFMQGLIAVTLAVEQQLLVYTACGGRRGSGAVPTMHPAHLTSADGRQCYDALLCQLLVA